MIISRVIFTSLSDNRIDVENGLIHVAGITENVGTINKRRQKWRQWKMRDWNIDHNIRSKFVYHSIADHLPLRVTWPCDLGLWLFRFETALSVTCVISNISANFELSTTLRFRVKADGRTDRQTCGLQCLMSSLERGTKI